MGPQIFFTLQEGTHGNFLQYHLLAAQALDLGYFLQYAFSTSLMLKLYGSEFVKSTTFWIIFFGMSVISGSMPSFGRIPPPSKPYFASSKVSKKKYCI